MNAAVTAMPCSGTAFPPRGVEVGWDRGVLASAFNTENIEGTRSSTKISGDSKPIGPLAPSGEFQALRAKRNITFLRENPWIFRVLRVENRQLQPHGRMTRRTVFDPACFSSGALWNFCNNSCSLCRKRLCCKFPLQRRVSAMRILPLPRGLTPGLTRGTVTAPMAEALVGFPGSAHG